MDQRIEIWNILHDGEITAVEEDGTGNVRMFVNIPYLRRRIHPLGDSFVLMLGGVSKMECRNFSESEVNTLREELEIGSPEILKTDSTEMPLKIDTTMGSLLIDFKTIQFRMDTGEEVDFDQIAKVCEQYWTEWKRKADHARGRQ
jgi:hypothetical protein